MGSEMCIRDRRGVDFVFGQRKKIFQFMNGFKSNRYVMVLQNSTNRLTRILNIGKGDVAGARDMQIGRLIYENVRANKRARVTVNIKSIDKFS